MKIGALFAGYGGLDMGVSSVLDAEIAWVSEIEEAPSRILAAHYPHAPNLGDVTKIDWSAVEPVDILTGGSPCQDLSMAGKRAGMKSGTRSGLWASMCDAIETLRPKLVIWENVRGALSAAATAGDVEQCEFCVGDTGEPPLRALGRVLGDLAECGYDAAWTGLRAADVGAPHRRWRVFVLAWPAASDTEGDRREAPRQTDDQARPVDAPVGPGDPAGGPDGLKLLPTPQAHDHTNGKTREQVEAARRRSKAGVRNLNEVVIHEIPLLPTPMTVNRTSAKAQSGRPTSGPTRGGPSFGLEDVIQLLPTPKAGDADFGLPRTSGRPPEMSTHLATKINYTDFGQYAPAIERWEKVLGRPAQPPTEPTGRDGAQRLSPRFVEWMMGLPDGWVTDPAIGITSNEQLKALGNGVVPQQAAAAIRWLLDVRARATGEVA